MKTILIIIACLVGLWMITAAIMPSESVITRKTEINASAEAVFNEINTLQNWKKWSYWEQADPKMTSNYSGPESGVGAAHDWKSEKMGNGKITITESNNPTSLKYELVFEGMSPSQGSLSIAGNEQPLSVTMELRMNLPFLFRPMGLISERMIGPDFEASLNGLKKLSESKQN
ncbi:MAG: SRPBCC family protein [Bacteroidota bacterium]